MAMNAQQQAVANFFMDREEWVEGDVIETLVIENIAENGEPQATYNGYYNLAGDTTDYRFCVVIDALEGY